MEKRFYQFIVAMATLVAASCSSGDDFIDDYFDIIDTPSGGSSAGSSASTAGTLTTFDIAIDSTAMAESETIPADDEDYLENNSFTETISIRYEGASATVTGAAEGVSISTSGAHVSVTSTAKGVNYVLSGSSADGSFRMASGDDNKKFQLTLDGVSLNNPTGATASGTDWHGLILSPTVSASGSTSATLSSLSSPYSTCGSSTGGMGGGGGQPGGGNWGGR